MSFWAEMKRRRVWAAAGAHVAATLALWGAIDFAADAFSLPAGFLRLVIIATIAAIPVTLSAAWFLDVRREAGGSRASVLKGLSFGIAAGLLVFAGLVTVVGFETPRATTNEIPGFGGRGAIAVMPFEDLSDEQAGSHFADGITDDLTTALQSWGVFPVISRGSTESFRDQQVTAPRIAAELGVRYLLLGTTRVANNTVRVSAQLVDAEADTQLWADRFDGALDDLFAIQDEITREIATAIAPEMARREIQRPRVERPADLATWELVHRATALIVEGTYEATLQAAELAALAVEREPAFAAAYVRLAEVDHNLSTIFAAELGDEEADSVLARGLDYARDAVRHGPTLVEARIWHGHLLMHHRQIGPGVAELREAVSLNPSHSQARAELSLGLAISGDAAGALESLDLAYRLGPNDPRNDRIRTFEALAYLYSGRLEEAAEAARRVIDADRGSALNTFAYVVEAASLTRLGRRERAEAVLSEFRSYYGELDWEGIVRGAWSEEELARVATDLTDLGMISHDPSP